MNMEIWKSPGVPKVSQGVPKVKKIIFLILVILSFSEEKKKKKFSKKKILKKNLGRGEFLLGWGDFFFFNFKILFRNVKKKYSPNYSTHFWSLRRLNYQKLNTRSLI